MSGQTIHMCLSVRGALSWTKREAKRNLSWLTKDGGERFASVEEMREALMDELSKGHEVLPCGPCESFDFKTGCPGHECAASVELAPKKK